jgi:hypothetical protein
MGKQRRIDLRVTEPEDQQSRKNLPASGYPVQHEIEELRKALAALNERIAELASDGHQGHAMEVLRVNAMDLACQIDELRCFVQFPDLPESSQMVQKIGG